MKQLGFLVLASALLLGCANEPKVAVSEEGRVFNKTTVSERNLHSFAKQLAVSMFDTMPKLNTDNRIAVGTFLPEGDLQNNQNAQLVSLGNQVQSSLQTLYTQVGASVIEFKASEYINIADNQDIMLSRTQNDLANKLAINYFLTGTISQVESGFIVNARLIDLTDKRVVSAATEMFPANVNWQENKVLLRDGNLYRSNY